MSGSDREALRDVREWSRGPPVCPGVVGSPSRMSGSGRNGLPDVWVRSEAPRMSGSGREALPDVRERSEAPWMSGSGREAHQDVREWS